MTESISPDIDVPSSDKEHSLKALQTWLDLKMKLGAFLLVGNGAVLGTTVAFIKDIGPKITETFPLTLGCIGIASAGIALGITADYANDRLSPSIEVTPLQTPERLQWLVRWLQRRKYPPMSLSFVNQSFKFFMFVSLMCLLGSVAYFSGTIQGRQDYVAAHPGSERFLNKW